MNTQSPAFPNTASLKQLSQQVPNASKLPVYKLIASTVLLAIDKGLWKPGDLIPPERFFIKEFGVSSGTIKRAMIELVNNGILYRRRGSGTYVPVSGFAREFRRYYLFLEDFNSAEHENKISLVSRCIIDPDEKICSLLNLPSQTPLIELTRSYSENGETIALNRSYYDARRFRRLLEILPARFQRVPLFVILEEDFKIFAENCQELFSVTQLPPEDARVLDVSPGYHALTIRSLTFDRRKQPFEYRLCLAKSESKSLFRNICY